MTDRRANTWSDPKTWVSICAILLTIVTFLLGLAIKELGDLHSDIRVILVSQAKDAGRIDAHDDRLRALENFKETQEKAYNFNFTTRLAGAESDIRALQQTPQKRGK